MFSNLKKLFTAPSTADRERAYLNESASQVDLEMRQREIDRGRFRQRRPGF